MPALLPLLGTLLTSLIGQIMIALGISAITYAGVDEFQSFVIEMLRTELGKMPPEAVQIFYMAGGGVALNWIFGGVAFALGFKTVSTIGSVLSKK